MPLASLEQRLKPRSSGFSLRLQLGHHGIVFCLDLGYRHIAVVLHDSLLLEVFDLVRPLLDTEAAFSLVL